MNKRWVMALAGAGLAVAGVAIFFVWFAPQPTSIGTDTMDDAMMLTGGAWQGDAGHQSSGNVGIFTDANGSFLFFEDFRQTSGPDVYLYVSTSEVGEFGDGTHWKVLVPGGAKDGQITVRGDFRVPLPDDVPIDDIRSTITWCDRFGVPFGHALVG